MFSKKEMELDKKLFKELVKEVRTNHPKLKIRIYWTRKTLGGGATGEYGWGTLNIAAGAGPDKGGWAWVIGAFAHEYSHYLRELKHTTRYSNMTYKATAIFYNTKAEEKKRKKALYWVLRDEYYTDVGGYEVLEKWGIDHLFPDWWRWAACYNYKIKYWFQTNIWLDGGDKIIKAPNRKLTDKEIMRPLSPKKKRYFQKLVEDKKVKVCKV